MKRLLLAILFGASLLLGAIEVSSSVDSRTVSQRESLQYTIEIVAQGNRRSTPEVQLPTFPDDFPFHVEGPEGPYVSTQTSVSIVNGRTTSRASHVIRYAYHLMPKRTGTFQIPAMAVQVEGEKGLTTPVTVKVVAPGAQGDPSADIVLKQSCEPEEAVPGLPVTLRYTVTLPLDRVRSIIAFETPRQIMARNFRMPENFDWQDSRNWHVTQRDINGIPCQIMTMEVEIVPRKAGTLTLPPFTMAIEVVDNSARSRRRRVNPMDPFDFLQGDPFFGRMEATRTVRPLSNEVTLRVSEPPEEGRPADYNGLVGQVKVDVRLSHTDVSVGDPIIAEITLSGPGVSQETRLPPLKDNPAVAEHFSVSGDDEPPTRDEATGALAFQMTLRAKKAGDLLFPALKIPYFDPATGSYLYASSAPVHVTAGEVKQVTLQDATIAAEQGAPAPAVAPSAAPPEENTQGLAADYSAREVLEDTSADTAHSLRKRLLLFAVLPAALWLACLLVRLVPVLRLSSPESRARNAALRELRRAATAYRPGDSAAADALYHALHEYAIRRFNLPGGTFGPADLEGKRLSQKQLATWREALETVEAIRFAGSAPSSDALRELIRKVEA